MTLFDPEPIRAQFPILSRSVNGKPLVYLDNAASAQKPRAVIEAMTRAMEGSYANVHRGLHTLANETTDAYEKARETVARFLGCATTEVVFTKGGTEAMNLVASSFGQRLVAGDEILITQMEHHSNIVPWHLLRERKGVVLRFAPVRGDGSLDLDAAKAMINEKTKLIAFTHMSNVLGTINPVRALTDAAHAAGALVLVDGCQGAVHMAVDVKALDVTPKRAISGSAQWVPARTATPCLSRIWAMSWAWAPSTVKLRMAPFPGAVPRMRSQLAPSSRSTARS